FSVTLPERTAYITLSLHDALPIWFVALAGWTLLQDHPRARHLELVTLAPHRLHQDAEVQLTASAHRVGVGRVGGFDPERDVALQLLEEPVPELARGDELAFPAREWRVVDYHVHRDGRLLDRNSLEPLGMIDCSEGLADLDPLEAGQRDDVACLGGRDLDPRQALEVEQPG